MKQVIYETPENTFSFTHDELAVLRAIIFYHACDTGDMSEKAGNITDRLNRKFQSMYLESSLEVWK